MEITPSEVITWLIVGALSGTLAGMLVKRRKQGFGHLLNLGVGLVGALIGGLLFKILDPEKLKFLSAVTVSLRDVVAGVLGSLVFLAIIWGVKLLWSRRKAAKSASQPVQHK